MLSELQKKDLQYNWHPYSQHQTMEPPIVITKGKDASLWDEFENEYIDAIGSWWANPHGHANEHIADRISQQINTIEHVLFGGYTHPTAIELSERLLNVLPSFHKVFYSDNGSTAVEVALKMALQFFLNKNKKKNNCVAFEGAFHGDTFGAMSVSGISLFTDSFADLFLPVQRIPVPNEKNWPEVKKMFQEIIEKEETYAFIFEPLVQGANAMKMYEPQYLNELLQMAKKYEVITIADEVMTGFGRTGKLFAIDYLNEKPDIICLSKALTGGFIPMSATLTTNSIFNGFKDEKVKKAFFHGHTFMANPAGCASALASLDLSMSAETQENIQRIQKKYEVFSHKISKYKFVKNIRNLGVIFAFEIDSPNEKDYYGKLRNMMYAHFMSDNIVARPVGNTIYYLPAYCISDEQLDKIFESTLSLLKKLEKDGY